MSVSVCIYICIHVHEGRRYIDSLNNWVTKIKNVLLFSVPEKIACASDSPYQKWPMQCFLNVQTRADIPWIIVTDISVSNNWEKQTGNLSSLWSQSRTSCRPLSVKFSAVDRNKSFCRIETDTFVSFCKSIRALLPEWAVNENPGADSRASWTCWLVLKKPWHRIRVKSPLTASAGMKFYENWQKMVDFIVQFRKKWSKSARPGGHRS